MPQAHGKDVLKPKYPLSRVPRSRRVKPMKNWLPFPTVGSKGLPTALSQTWCNDDSISFEFGWKRCCAGRKKSVSVSVRISIVGNK